MLKPVYIVCCENSLEDKTTGLQSYINIYEKILFHKNPAEVPPAPPTQIRVFALWVGEREDIGRQFESEVNVVLPGPSETVLELDKGTTTCTGEGWIRVTAHLIGTPPIEGPGIMRLQSRMRRVGDENWLTQEYPIIFAEFHIQEPAATA